jgi:hypothetical protein
MKIGDLIVWPQGDCDTPGLVIDMRPARKMLNQGIVPMNPAGMAVLAMLPDLPDLEWFHERELEEVR